MGAYKKTVLEHEYEKKKVKFTHKTMEDEFKKDPELAMQELEEKAAIMASIDKEKYDIEIEKFIYENYLHLPQDNHLSKFKLIKSLQADAYLNIRKRDEVQTRSLLAINEDRRKRLGLPALTPIDYNCIERAVLKLRLIVECLMISKQMSGSCLLSKDVILGKMQ